MPAARLPELETFLSPGHKSLWLSGEPETVTAGGREYLDFAEDCFSAERLLRGLEGQTSEYLGPEADQFREKLDDSLPDWLSKTGRAHQVVGAAIVSFGTDFGFQRSVMHGLRGRAPGAHAAVQTAADQVNALEDALATARSAEATAHADHAASVTATAAAAATPAAPAAAIKEGQALSTLTAATAHANAVAGQLSAAWGRYTAAVGVWERLLGDGEGVHRRMEAITQTAVDVLDGQKDTPFEENPKGWKAFWKSVGNWIDEHADVLKTISEVLITVGSLVALLPGLGTLVGGIIAGIGVGIGLALTLTGNMSWGEFAMSAVGAIPGAGKGAQLAKLGMKGVGKNAAKELAERARPSRYICRGAEPVDMATGAMVDDFVDLTIGGELPLIVERKAVSSFGLGTAFGPSWASLFDCRVEVDADGIALVNVDGSVLWYDRPDPDAVGEVMPRVGTMPLSFVDGAYRVRNVAAGVTYEFSVVGDEGSVRMTADEPHQDEVPRDSVLAVGSVPVAGSSSLAGVADSAVVIGLSAVVSRTGHRFELVYDQQSGLVREVRHGGGAVVEVDTDAVTGRVLGLAVRDEVGVSTPVVSYRYDARANLAEVVNSSGVPMRFAYDDAARIVSWTDRNRVSYHYRYDDRGRVVRQVGTSGMFPNALVHLPDVGADAPVGGRIVVLVETVTDVLAEHERDERIEERLARLAQLPIVALLESGGLAGAGLTGRGRDGAVDSSVVEPGLVVAEELLVDEVLGRIQPWVYRSTAAGDVWRIVSAEGVVTEFEHDVHHNPTAFTGGDGARWETVFDEFGCEVATTDPQGRVSSIERGTWGMPARVTDEAGRVSEAVLDGFGSVVAVTDPVGAVTRFEHVVRASGVVTAARVDADGARTEFDYDAAGRVVRVIDPAQRVWSFERNVFGDVVAVTDPDGAVTSSEFTVEGWLLGQVYPDGTGVRLGYDAEGNQVEVVDEAGHVTRTEYTVFDHPRAVIDPSGGRVEIGYDSTMEQTWVRSPDGLSWRFERDRDARVVAETDYNGARSTFGLDGLGRPVVVTDALGHVRARRFDLLGRLVSEAATADGVTEYGYDVAGDLVSVVNGDARVEFERDGVGRVVAETVNGVVVRSRFDSVGRRTDREVTTGGRSWSATFGFDAAGRLAGIDAGGRFSTPEGRRIGFGYDGAGRESERRFGRSARLRQSFDRRGRLSRQHVLAGAERVAGGEQATGAQRLVAGRVWSYRADGYVTGVDDAVAGATRFDVDASGRVTAAVPSTVGGTRAAGTGAGGGEWFGYTPSGVLARADSGAGQPVGVAASPVAGVARVDGSDRVSRSGTLVTRVGRDRFTYDAAGRLRVRVRARLSRKAEVTEFSYTDGGQIREVGCGDGTRWRYGYDGLGRRVSKSHVDRDGRILDEVVFGWDGNDLVLQSNTALTPRGPVAAGASSTWVWTYHPDGGDVVSQEVVHHTPHTDTTPDKTTPDITPPDITPPVAYPAPDGHRGGVDGWSQGRVDTEFYAIVADLAGAPTELVDPLTGQVAGRAVRSVWGHTTWQGVSSPLGFAGQQHDPESGLFYNRFRFYNPATATYTSPDPLGVGPNPASATAYVHNPHVAVDPLGLKIHFKGKGDFWTRKEVKGKNVWQRDDLFDPTRVDERGRTNLERMKRGNAPIGHDGNPLNLHHIGQRDNSPIVELTQQVHKENHGLLHINPSSTPSGINRSAFDSWRGRYWRARRHDFT